MLSLVAVIGVFYSFYPARLVRSQVLSLKEQEFVEAARMIGSSDIRIMRKHLFPHVSGSLIVYGTQLLALTIFLEAALAILGVGIEPGYASWGSIIATHYGTLFGDTGASAHYIDSRVAPRRVADRAVALGPPLLTVSRVTLFGEGVRNAFDPQGCAPDGPLRDPPSAGRVVLLFAMTILTFALFRLIPLPGGCLIVPCGPDTTTDDAQIAAAEHELGTDRPVVVQYGEVRLADRPARELRRLVDPRQHRPADPAGDPEDAVGARRRRRSSCCCSRSRSA